MSPNLVRASLLAAAAIFVALPLVCQGAALWPACASPGLGLLLLVLIAAFYALGPARSRLDPADALLILVFPLYLLYTANGTLGSSGDNDATRNLPRLLLETGGLDLSPLPAYHGVYPHYSGLGVGEKILPRYPLGTGLLVTPYEAAALLVTRRQSSGIFLERLEKHSASILVALSALLLFWAVRSRFDERSALATALVFGAGTSAFSSASQGLWSFTGELFFICLALALLPPPRRTALNCSLAGLACTGAFLCRPTAVLLTVLTAGALFLVHRAQGVWFATAAGLGHLAVCVYLWSLYGHPLGGYGLAQLIPSMWRSHPLTGIGGALVSPSRGLLVFSPFLLAAPALFLAARGNRAVRFASGFSMAAVLAYVILVGTYAVWWGGAGFGPRLLAETAPFQALAILPLWTLSARTWLRRLTFFAVCVSAVTHLLGAYTSQAPRWNETIARDTHLNRLWSIPDSQLAAVWTPGWRPPAFAPPSGSPRGREDGTLTGSLDEPVPGTRVRGTLRVRGWARTPEQDLDVAFLVDGVPRPPLSIRRFGRPDVLSAVPRLNDTSHAGYVALISFEEGDAGPHRLTVVFIASGGRIRHYPSIDFHWAP